MLKFNISNCSRYQCNINNIGKNGPSGLFLKIFFEIKNPFQNL